MGPSSGSVYALVDWGPKGIKQIAKDGSLGFFLMYNAKGDCNRTVGGFKKEQVP